MKQQSLQEKMPPPNQEDACECEMLAFGCMINDNISTVHGVRIHSPSSRSVLFSIPVQAASLEQTVFELVVHCVDAYCPVVQAWHAWHCREMKDRH